MVTLDRIREPEAAVLFPQHVLEGCETALVLFAAAFYGKQDAVWIADAGMTATCVDTDGERLCAMEFAYPHDWTFINQDAFSYAWTTDETFDIVTVDCPTPLFDECAKQLPLWCDLATRAVVLGVGRDTRYEVPDGWVRVEKRHRSNFAGGVWWAVFRKLDDPLAEEWRP